MATHSSILAHLLVLPFLSMLIQHLYPLLASPVLSLLPQVSMSFPASISQSLLNPVVGCSQPSEPGPSLPLFSPSSPCHPCLQQVSFLVPWCTPLSWCAFPCRLPGSPQPHELPMLLGQPPSPRDSQPQGWHLWALGPGALGAGRVSQDVLGCVCLFVTLWTVDCQAPLSMEFPGKNAGVGCHFLLHTKLWGTCMQ